MLEELDHEHVVVLVDCDVVFLAEEFRHRDIAVRRLVQELGHRNVTVVFTKELGD